MRINEIAKFNLFEAMFKKQELSHQKTKYALNDTILKINLVVSE